MVLQLSIFVQLHKLVVQLKSYMVNTSVIVQLLYDLINFHRNQNLTLPQGNVCIFRIYHQIFAGMIYVHYVHHMGQFNVQMYNLIPKVNWSDMSHLLHLNKPIYVLNELMVQLWHTMSFSVISFDSTITKPTPKILHGKRRRLLLDSTVL